VIQLIGEGTNYTSKLRFLFAFKSWHFHLIRWHLPVVHHKGLNSQSFVQFEYYNFPLNTNCVCSSSSIDVYIKDFAILHGTCLQCSMVLALWLDGQINEYKIYSFVSNALHFSSPAVQGIPFLLSHPLESGLLSTPEETWATLSYEPKFQHGYDFLKICTLTHYILKSCFTVIGTEFMFRPVPPY
jgi:hypothetical protein